jgi:hypothetical protein
LLLLLPHQLRLPQLLWLQLFVRHPLLLLLLLLWAGQTPWGGSCCLLGGPFFWALLPHLLLPQ